MGAALTVSHLFSEPAKADAVTQVPHTDVEQPTTSSDFKRDRVPTTLLQNETLVDVFSCMTRDELDLVRFCSRRLRQVIDECMATVCLRHIVDARLSGSTLENPSFFRIVISRKLPESEQKKDGKEDGSSSTEKGKHSPRITRRDGEEHIEHTLKDPLEALEFLLVRLKSGVVTNHFNIYCVALTHKFCDKTAEIGSSVFINNLYVDSVDSSPETLRRFIAGCFGEVRAVRLNDSYNSLYPGDVSDELLRECAVNGIYKLVLEVPLPKHADRFLLSDDGILDFCFEHKEDKPKELKAYSIVVSPQFFDRLVQANKKSNLTAKMRIKVQVVRDPLFDTSNYERNRKQYGTMQVYDFPGDVRFQILLYPHDVNNPQEWTIDLRRCKEPTDGSRFFY